MSIANGTYSPTDRSWRQAVEPLKVPRRLSASGCVLLAALTACSSGHAHALRSHVAAASASWEFRGCDWRGDIPEIRILVSNESDSFQRLAVSGRFSADPSDTDSDLFTRQVYMYPRERRLVILRGDPRPRQSRTTRKPACEMMPSRV